MSPRDKRKRKRRYALVGWAIAAGLGALALVPGAFVLVGTRRATACFRGYEAPRGPELPSCADTMEWFSFPARVPWTVTPATYRAEELRIRIATGHYRNAIVGRPDRVERTRAAELMEQAETIVRSGSRRLAFEELGPAAGAPDRGQDALLLGDRSTLLLHGKDWSEWHQRLHTLQAALLEGDLPGAIELAKHYATYDPREEDLRAALGAVLCLGGDTKRGMAMFALQQNDRAARRYAGMARNWGDVRTALLACAALGNETPPPRPESSEAGQDDDREVRAPLRLRLSEDPDNRLREAQDSAVQLLSSALGAGARAPILAALLASGATLPVETWADLATARTGDGEPSLLDLGSVNVLSWLDVPSNRPIAVGSVYRRGAGRLFELAGAAPAEVRPSLEAAAGALWIEGARAYARGAEVGAALEMLERAAPLVQMDGTTRALAEALVRYASGDGEGALTALAQAPDGGSEPELRAATLALRAEIGGAVGRLSQDDALAAYEAAQTTDSAALSAWTRRLRFWAAPWTEPAAEVSIDRIDAMAGRFSLWPSLGYANRTVQWSAADDQRLAVLDRHLGVWKAARSAPPEEMRAFRYALMRHRGDMPDALVPYLAVAGELADGGDVEVWLDAVMATDAPRFSMRAYAWARANAARARGDKAAASLWTERFKKLSAIAGDETRAELARLLGI